MLINCKLMKIGFDAKRMFFNKTGLGNYSRELLKMLLRYHGKHSYYLYTPARHNLFPSKDIAAARLRLPMGFLNKRFPSLWRSFSVVNQLKKDQLDLYHGLSQELPMNMAKTRIKTIVTVHDLIFLRHPKWYHKTEPLLYDYKTRKALRQANKIIAISRQTKQDLIDFYRYPEKKIEVLYQSCDELFKQVPNLEQQTAVRLKYNLPDHYVLNVGTVEARKNLLTLVKALKPLKIPLVVVGNTQTAYAKDVKTYVAKNNMQNRIHFLQNVPLVDLPALYQMAEVFCYPSFFEGFGIPILEALYSQTPVITSTGSCFIEAGGPDSLYVNPGSVIDLQEALKQLLYCSSSGKNMAKSGLVYAQRFNKTYLANQLIKIYKNTLS